MKSVLVASSNSSLLQETFKILSPLYDARMAKSLKECLQYCEKQYFEFLFLDIELVLNPTSPSNVSPNYTKVFQSLWQFWPSTSIIMLGTPRRMREMVQAVKSGANNYLTSPIQEDELRLVIENTQEVERMQVEIDYLRDQFWQVESAELVKTNSPAMMQVFKKVRSVAFTKTTVLLQGETGVGKSMIASLIHQHSNRKDAPFLHVHCGAIPDTLIESELFGHEKGAFTGAVRRKLGRFEVARGGTLFLDEISTISAAAQIKLLQVLQEKIFQRLGGESMLESDVRIIAASNVDLKIKSLDNSFRSDLYYRLSVFPIEIPPLRERIEDIPQLVEKMMRKLNQTHPRKVEAIEPATLEALQSYDWPGNIRELENVIERAFILESSRSLTPESLPQELQVPKKSKAGFTLNTNLKLAEVRNRAIEQVERQYLKELLGQTQGKINQTAEMAGIGTRQLHKLLIKYGIRKEDFKRNA